MRASRMVQLLLAVLVFGLLSAPARADTQWFGPSFDAAANLIERFQQDVAYWNEVLRKASQRMPSDGQVLEVDIKGMAIQPAGAATPENMIHIQTLDSLDASYARFAPRSGAHAVRGYLGSAAFYLPYTGDPQQVSVFTPENLCV